MDANGALRGKYLSLATFRSDGTVVATPVWFVEYRGLLYVYTDGESYKAKRICAKPVAVIATCSAAGRPKMASVNASANIINDMPNAARKLYARKYRFDRVVLLPMYRLLKALQHKPTASGKQIAIVLTPEHS